MRTSELGDPSLNSADLDASLLRPREKAQVSAPGRRTAEQRRKRRRLLPRLGPPGPRLSTVDSRPFCSKTWHSAALRCGAVLFATFTRKQGLDEAWGARVRTDGDLPGSPNRPRMTRKLERSEHHHIIKGAPALAPSPRPWPWPWPAPGPLSPKVRARRSRRAGSQGQQGSAAGLRAPSTDQHC